jgi:hypothetical protein
MIARFSMSHGAGRRPRAFPMLNVPQPEQIAAKALIPKNSFLVLLMQTS